MGRPSSEFGVINFFDGWGPIARVLVIGPLAYAAMVILLRVSGKRTLSKMNAFDFVVTVALGSVLATIITDSTIALATGVTVIAVLVVSQLIVTYLSVRWGWVERVVKADPTLLVLRGRPQKAAMRTSRVTEAEIAAAVRSSGRASIGEVDAVVLETDGTLTVIAGESVEVIDNLPGR